VVTDLHLVPVHHGNKADTIKHLLINRPITVVMDMISLIMDTMRDTMINHRQHLHHLVAQHLGSNIKHLLLLVENRIKILG
jgi:hypothetical protein